MNKFKELERVLDYTIFCPRSEFSKVLIKAQETVFDNLDKKKNNFWFKINFFNDHHLILYILSENNISSYKYKFLNSIEEYIKNLNDNFDEIQTEFLFVPFSQNTVIHGLNPLPNEIHDINLLKFRTCLCRTSINWYSDYDSTAQNNFILSYCFYFIYVFLVNKVKIDKKIQPIDVSIDLNLFDETSLNMIEACIGSGPISIFIEWIEILRHPLLKDKSNSSKEINEYILNLIANTFNLSDYAKNLICQIALQQLNKHVYRT